MHWLALTVLLASSSPSAPQRAFVLGSRIHVRNGAWPAAGIVGELPIASSVQVVGVRGEFSKIRTKGLKGWVRTDLLSPTRPTEASLLAAFDETPRENARERQVWAERAAAIAPRSERALTRLVRALFLTNDSSLSQARHALYAIRPAFFDAGTYVDKIRAGVWTSPLSCRKALIERVFATSQPVAPAKGPWKTSMSSLGTQLMLSRACTELSPGRQQRALVVDEEKGTARWIDAELEFELRVETHIEQGPMTIRPPAAALGLIPRVPKSAVLLSTWPTAPPERELPYRPLEASEEVDAGRGRMRRAMRGHEAFESIASIHLERQTKTFTGIDEVSREVTSRMALVVTWRDNTQTIIHEERGFGQYTYADAHIGSVIAADIDVDGDPDFLFEIGGGGRVLITTQQHEPVGYHTLRVGTYSITGC